MLYFVGMGGSLNSVYSFINVVTAEVTHKAFCENPKKELRVTIEKTDVLLKFQGINLQIEISGSENIDKLEKILFGILSLGKR